MATAAPISPAVERSVSPTGEFIIYGHDAQLRGAISSAAETTKSNLLSLLRCRDSWSTAIVINLQSRAANLPELPNSALRFNQTESGLKLQLDLVISHELDSAETERELLRAILLEMIYRKQSAIAAGESHVEPPAWLVEGLLASMPGRDRGSFVRALNACEKITSLTDFLRQNFELLNPAWQIVYRGYSFALIQWLLGNEEGRARVGRYIDYLASASNDSVAEFRSAFPEVAAKDLEKNWQSRISALKKSNELLTFSETEKELDDLLETRFPAAAEHGKSVSLSTLCLQRADRAQEPALKKFAQQLMLLSTRANPVLRPVVEEYQQLVARLALRKNHGVSARLAELEKLRARLLARMTEVDDYMNWFEATQLNTASGLFDDSLKLRESTTHRKDPLSIYLDAVEQQN